MKRSFLATKSAYDQTKDFTKKSFKHMKGLAKKSFNHMQKHMDYSWLLKGAVISSAVGLFLQVAGGKLDLKKLMLATVSGSVSSFATYNLVNSCFATAEEMELEKMQLREATEDVLKRGVEKAFRDSNRPVYSFDDIDEWIEKYEAKSKEVV